MRGEVLCFDEASDHGLIAGDDGLRYNFAREDLGAAAILPVGSRVDFVADGEWASQIMTLATATSPSSPPAPTVPGFDLKFALLSLNGRLRRLHYWLGSFAVTGIGIAISFVLMPLMFLSSILGSLGSLILLAVVIWTELALAVKRLHDLGRSGWLLLVPAIAVPLGFTAASGMMLAQGLDMTSGDLSPVAFANLGMVFGIMFIPVILMAVFGLWMAFADGQKGENAYGPDPKGR